MISFLKKQLVSLKSKMTFHSEPEINFWTIQRELDLQHDKMMEDFARRDREWDERRKQVREVCDWSSKCTTIIMDLHREGLISHKIFSEFLSSPEWTAYLPIEIGDIVRKAKQSEDAIILFKIYKF
jgi:hypothetical protein